MGLSRVLAGLQLAPMEPRRNRDFLSEFRRYEAFTVSDDKMCAMIIQVESNVSNDKTAPHLLFGSKPLFGKYWSVPSITTYLVSARGNWCKGL
jgi:hypothetical protein